MELDKKTGIFLNAIFYPSPNCDYRPENETISLLVIHNISLPPGDFSYNWVPPFFTNQLDIAAHPYFEEIQHLAVSSHLYIRRNGQLWQFVPLMQRAWHAGESTFQGKSKCNDFSIGIELEGTDEVPYSEQQYDILTKVSYEIIKMYPQITLDRIAGHDEIAPMRKTDPGLAFNWTDYRERLKNILDNKHSSHKTNTILVENE